MLESWLGLFWVTLLVMAWWPCSVCCRTSEECDPCSQCTYGTPCTIPVALTGLTDNNCYCSSLNDTFITTQNVSYPCRWEYDDLVWDCGDRDSTTLQLYILCELRYEVAPPTNDAQWFVRVRLTRSGFPAHVQYWDFDKWDRPNDTMLCEATHTLTFGGEFHDYEDFCDESSPTCTLN